MTDLSQIAKALKKKYTSSRIAESEKDKLEYISTGNIAFDLISDGGIPFGFSTEFLGLSQSGKSLYIQQIIANAQSKYDAVGILADRENAYSKPMGEKLGINNSNLLVAKPADIPTPYDGFSFIIDSIKLVRQHFKDRYIVVGLDSVSAFSKDVDLAKSDSGRKAKAIHEGMRELLTFIDDKIAIVIANQVTYKISITWGDPKTSTAGESLKYYSTMRFSLEERRLIVDPAQNNEVVGAWLGIECMKTRLGPCHRACYLPVFYESGIDPYGGYARLLAHRGYLVPKNKSTFKSFNSVTLQYGDETVNEFRMESFLEKHPELLFESYPEFNPNHIVTIEEEEDED